MASTWKIISGGQTGVDRAALDLARTLGLAYGGFVPKGRRTEDGPLPDDYAGMIELDSPNYAARTIRNLLEADATLILTRGAADGGTLLTLEMAQAKGRPVLVVDLADEESDVVPRIRAWLGAMPTGTLNIAGPRESRKPGIRADAQALLIKVFENWN